MMDHRTAVVILNWNGRQFLEIFLPILIARTPSARLVVADNCSTDDSREYLRDNFPEVELLVLDDNYGFTGGYNRALAQVEAEYFVLLNSDIEVEQGWLEPLVEMMDRNSDVAAIQPKILSFAQKDRFEYAGASGGFIDALGYPFCRGRFIGVKTEVDRGQYDDSREVFWASGAALMIRSSLYREIGGLDENFFAHMEEIDLCWRLKRAGYRIMVEPRSVVYHIGGGTLPVWSAMKTYYNFRNNIAMLYKNQSRRRFFCVYYLRLWTDFLRLLTYLIPMKWSFAAAIFRGHRDFWRMRKKLDRQNHLPHKTVKQTYRGSIILRQLFGRKTFGNMIKILILFVLMVSCGTVSSEKSSSSATTSAKTPVSGVEIVAQYPHSTSGYTQGLLIYDGMFYESTGEYGQSTLRIVEPTTGEVKRSIALDDKYFAEGLELIGDKLYQLTWMEQKCFVYDRSTLEKIGEFAYRGEGWGLATDGTVLYMSDGSNVITIRDPETFEIKGRIGVHDSEGPVVFVNEMEWIEGKLWANIYLDNTVAVIDPSSGKIERYIDMTPLARSIGNSLMADVLNGIAYDKQTKKIYLTGKLWDTMFEIKEK